MIKRIIKIEVLAPRPGLHVNAAHLSLLYLEKRIFSNPI
jgi:hypothetical protein